MKTNIFLFTLVTVIALSLKSCISLSSEFNRPRQLINPITQKRVPSIFFELIDTSKIYKRVYKKENSEKSPSQNTLPMFLKFYKEGKIAIFKGFEPNNVEIINPEFADMGIYRFRNNQLVLKEFIRTIQGSAWVTWKTNLSKNIDTITFKSNHYVEKFVPIDIPQSFLIYKPDW